MSDKKRIVLVGATGGLGKLIARALLDKGVELHCLVRPESRSKAADLEAAGAVLVTGSLNDSQAELSRALTGAFAVVSAIQGGPDMIVDAQLRLLAAAREAGVRRLIPSDFSFDFNKLSAGENLNSDWRRSFAQRAEAERGAVQVVHIYNGCFLDTGVLFGFLGAIDLQAGQAFLWGDGEVPMDFTTYADTARYTAEAATMDGTPPDHFQVAGEVLNFHELLAAYKRGSGRELEVVHKGSLAAMDAEIARRQAAEPDNVLAYLPLMYWRGMLSGKGKLDALINQQFPGIKPTTVAEYVRSQGL